MIKGINKQVLEILEPSSGYFEKALFFVKPEYTGFSENKLKEMAHNELKSVLKPPLQKSKNTLKNIRIAILGVSTFIIGVVLGFLISYIIWFFTHNVLI